MRTVLSVLRRLVPGLLAAAVTLPALAQDVELYDQPRFNGVRLRIAADAPDLGGFGMGGRVASVVVLRGQWEFCTAVQYGGACITVGPGRYGELPPALRGTLMSVRQASNGGVATGTPRPLPAPQEPAFYPDGRVPGGRPGMNFPPGGATEPAGIPAAIVLFEFQDFTGEQLPLASAVNRLSEKTFNDRASAVEIHRGRWQLCQHSDYQGECQVLGPGRHVLGGRLFGSLSSLRPVVGQDNRPLPGAGTIVLFEHGGFQGRQLVLIEAAPDLSAMNFNDLVSSVEVLAGQWELCFDAGYRGSCIVLGPGRHNLERGNNDRISSVRPRSGRR